MPYEPKDNTFTLSRNDKRKKDTDPEYTGTAIINGEERWINAWVKEVKNGPRAGHKFFSGNFRPKNSGGPRGGQSGGQQRQQPASQSASQATQDEIPF